MFSHYISPFMSESQVDEADLPYDSLNNGQGFDMELEDPAIFPQESPTMLADSPDWQNAEGQEIYGPDVKEEFNNRFAEDYYEDISKYAGETMSDYQELEPSKAVQKKSARIMHEKEQLGIFAVSQHKKTTTIIPLDEEWQTLIFDSEGNVEVKPLTFKK